MQKFVCVLIAGLLLPLACRQRSALDTKTPDIQEVSKPLETPQVANAVAWTYQENPENVVSPGRGFYSWNAADTDKGLALIRIVLAPFCGTETLDASVLNSVASRLEDLRKIPGKQAIVRVLYADDGVLNPCGLAEAARPDIAIQHLKQLAPIFRNHRQDIAFFEAGFFGMWGEWNSEYAPSGRGYAEDPQLRFNMVRALLDQLPEDFLIMLRRPRFRAELASKMSPTEMRRLAFHNDCYLASATDMGTYDGDLTPDQWRDHIGALSKQGQAIGGETCLDEAVYTNCEAALKDMKRLGMTYLNTGWNPAVLQRWKNEGCFATVEKQLGYRFLLQSVGVEQTNEQQLKLNFTVFNAGFAPAYQLFQPQLALVNEAGQSFELKIDSSTAADPRAWLAGQTVAGQLVANLASVPKGSYRIQLRWKYYDRVLRFAVQSIWDQTAQTYQLGYMSI